MFVKLLLTNLGLFRIISFVFSDVCVLYRKKVQTMKKLIALTLVLLMILPMATMASAVNLNDQTPIIYIRGNGEPLYNAQASPRIS